VSFAACCQPGNCQSDARQRIHFSALVGGGWGPSAIAGAALRVTRATISEQEPEQRGPDRAGGEKQQQEQAVGHCRSQTKCDDEEQGEAGGHDRRRSAIAPEQRRDAGQPNDEDFSLPTRISKSDRQRRGAQCRYQCEREITNQIARAASGSHGTDRQASGRSGKAERQLPEQRREQDRPDKAEAGNYSLGKFKLGLAVPAQRLAKVSLCPRRVAIIPHSVPTAWR
jgi:hypothetical protein